MSDRIDPSSWPTPRGPWSPVTDITRRYDHGRPWCINRGAHPDNNDGYPVADQHWPWDECQTPAAFVDDVTNDLAGEELEMSVYCATSFRFGQPRGTESDDKTKLVLETWLKDSETTSMRISLPLGEALRLARVIEHQVDAVTLHPR